MKNESTIEEFNCLFETLKNEYYSLEENNVYNNNKYNNNNNRRILKDEPKIINNNNEEEEKRNNKMNQNVCNNDKNKFTKLQIHTIQTFFEQIKKEENNNIISSRKTNLNHEEIKRNLNETPHSNTNVNHESDTVTPDAS
jgi:hypothetical protein